MELIEGERLQFEQFRIPNNSLIDDEQINEKYIQGEVRIVTEQARYPLTSIAGMIESGDYALNPEFQRRHRWDILQKSKLIESFIMNVPIPPIFLYEDKYSHYEVMDGLQRLTAIFEFYKDRYALEGLEQWPELNGKLYTQLPIQIRKGIDRRYLSSIILLQETAKSESEARSLKQLVFERINSGGVKLEPQETRNAIFNGPLNQLCLKLSRNAHLCNTWNIPPPDQDELIYGLFRDELRDNPSFSKMEDVELVLRFFANRQRDILYKSGVRYRDFLDDYLRFGNDFGQSTLGALETLFNSTIEFVNELFGPKAFWLYRYRNNNWIWYSRPTTAVYDTLMLVAARYLENSTSILAKKAVIDSLMEEFYKQNYDTFEGRNTNPTIISEREARFDELFKSFLNQ